MSTNASFSSSFSSSNDWESASASSGTRTPTQRFPHPSHSTRGATPDLPLDIPTLARLLQPTDYAERQDARIFASHLSCEKPLTRAQYRKLNDSANAHVLTSTRYRPPGFLQENKSGRLSPFEEAEVLEYLILCSCGKHNDTETGATETGKGGTGANDWQSGAEGLGAGGPQCVVCQSAPRTILVWPCRCLSLCEECRVSLAMNNLATYVCCRQDVVGFSRLFVPGRGEGGEGRGREIRGKKEWEGGAYGGRTKGIYDKGVNLFISVIVGGLYVRLSGFLWCSSWC